MTFESELSEEKERRKQLTSDLNTVQKALKVESEVSCYSGCYFPLFAFLISGFHVIIYFDFKIKYSYRLCVSIGNNGVAVVASR